MLGRILKDFLKKYFYKIIIWDKLSTSTQIQQVQLYHYYKDCNKNNRLPNFNDTGFKVFSQFEEDGKLLFLFSIIGMGNKKFVDLGSNDCINSNCANFAIHFGWYGLFVDGDKKVIEIGKHFYKKTPNLWSYKPKFLNSFITVANVNDLIKNQGFEGEIELLSIDIDGNDYWVWDALEVIQPKVVIIESQVAFGLQNIIVPYAEKYTADLENNYYCGASNLALQKLGTKKGYRLVGANEYGNNLFFVKNGIAEKEIPEVDFETTLKHPFATDKFRYFNEMNEYKFTQG